MANWCYNTITFSGKCKNFIKQLKKHDYNNCGFEILPGKNMKCIFELYKVDETMFSFESKWGPPLDELCERARKGRFSFEIDYEELSNQIYGRAFYNAETNEFVDYYLRDDTFNLIDWDDDICRIDGKIVESEYEFLEEELEKMMNNK